MKGKTQQSAYYTDLRHARRDAFNRLANLHPIQFANLYNEERVKRGLPPVKAPERRPVRAK